MKTFAVHDLIWSIKVTLRQGSLIASLPPQYDRRTVIQGLRKEIDKLLVCCNDAGLEMSAIAVKRLYTFFDYVPGTEDMVVSSIYDALSRVVQIVIDECSLRTYFSLDPDEAKMYATPLLGWEEVVSRFDKVRGNIIESAKCMALERFGAAVFHALLVAEYGVIQVATLMNVQGDKPGWGSLKRLNDVLLKSYPQRSLLEQQHSQFLESVIPLTTVIKDNWRHKLEHVDNQIVWIDTDFSPEVAEEIITAIRGFMRKLASDLPQEAQ